MNAVTDGATDAQNDFIEGLRKQLHISRALLSSHTQRAYGHPVEALTKRDASLLIDEMLSWREGGKGLPADLQRAAGQADLPGFGS